MQRCGGWFSKSPLTFTVANYTGAAPCGAFDFCRSHIRYTLIWINFRGFPPRSKLFSYHRPRASFNPSLQLSPRRRCRKSRVHFPHFSPSWRAARTTVKGWDAEKSCGGWRLRGRENTEPRNFTLRGCETSPLRRNGPQTAAGAYDILPHYFMLILGITLLVSTDSVFKQLCEQIATFCGINLGFVTWTIVGVKDYETTCKTELMLQAHRTLFIIISKKRKLMIVFKEIPLL